MARMSLPQVKEPPLFRIQKFRGVNLRDTASQIEDNQAADMLNMHLDERGSLNKRTGYARVFPFDLGEGAINGMSVYRKNGATMMLFAHTDKLYKFNTLPGVFKPEYGTWESENLEETWEV